MYYLQSEDSFDADSIIDGIIKQTLTNRLLVGERKNAELYYSRNGRIPGAVARYLIGLIPINPQNGFPIKTLLINIIGAFVIGLVVAFGAKKDWNPN